VSDERKPWEAVEHLPCSGDACWQQWHTVPLEFAPESPLVVHFFVPTCLVEDVDVEQHVIGQRALSGDLADAPALCRSEVSEHDEQIDVGIGSKIAA
jgi:hypothetical protein